jgi:hypothetical protein
MDKDREAFYRTPNIIISDTKYVHEGCLDATLPLADFQPNHASLWDTTLDQIGGETTGSSMGEPDRIASSLESWKKDMLWRINGSADASNVRVDTFGGATNGLGHGEDHVFLRIPTLSESCMTSLLPESGESKGEKRRRGADPVRPSPIRPFAPQSVRTLSLNDSMESYGGLSIMVSASPKFPKPRPPLSSYEIKPEANKETNPEAKDQVLLEAKQNADSKTNSYFASNGSAPLAKERDTLGKLFEKYRG